MSIRHNQYLPGLFNSNSNSFVPSNLSGLQIWFDPKALSNIQLSGSNVSQIIDRSPNAWVAAPAATTQGPVLELNYRNGNPVLNFNVPSIAYNLVYANGTTFVNAGTPYHMFVFVNSGDFSIFQFGRLFNLGTTGFSSSPTGYFLFFSNATGYQGLNVGFAPPSTDWIRGANMPIGADTILEITWNGLGPPYLTGYYTLTYNGTTSDTPASSGMDISQNNVNSFGSASQEANSSFNGAMGDFIMYNRILSTPERTQVINYLRTAWSI